MTIYAQKHQTLFIIIAAFLSALCNEGKSLIWDNIVKEKNYNILQTIVDKLINTIDDFHIKQSLEDIINLLPGYYIEIENTKVSLNCQVQLFHKRSGNFIGSLPFDEYNPQIRQIYLVSDFNGTQNEIVSFIPKLNLFFKRFGTYCFFCHQFFTSRGCIHKCAQTTSCFSCHRPYLQQNTYVTYETSDLFCDGLLKPSPSFQCSQCNVTYFSSNCLEKHQKKVCRWGWKCNSCQIFQSCNSFYKSQKDIKEKHKCNQRTCNFCGEIREFPHFCSLKEVKESNEFTNLAFVVLEYSGYNIGKCVHCYKRADQKPCKECLDGLEQPICCAIFQEETSRDTFSLKYLFSRHLEKCIQEQNNVLLKTVPNAFRFEYIPKFIANKATLAPEGRKTHFGQRRKNDKFPNVFKCQEKENMNLMQIFFDYLIHNNFSNSTILVYSGVHRDMFYILQGLIENGFSPKVIKNNNQIMLIEEKRLGLRFVEIQNFLHLNFKEICSRISQKEPFFPLQWIQKSFFSYSGLPPSLKDFFNFEDSSADITAKKEYVIKLNQESSLLWNFQRALALFLKKKTEIIATAMLDFIKETFCCQQILIDQLGDSKTTYLHPLNAPIFTAATYAFQLFLKFAKEAKRIKTVNNAIPFKSSKGEIEYIEYLKWKHPEKKFEYAWSSKGERDLYFSKPDAYFDDTIWYYHGCYFHNHKKNECLYKRKKLIDSTKTREDFDKKIDLIKTNYNIKKVVIMWECVWHSLKKQDSDVQFFMKNIFSNPPMHRLQPRDAGKVQCLNVCARSLVLVYCINFISPSDTLCPTSYFCPYSPLLFLNRFVPLCSLFLSLSLTLSQAYVGKGGGNEREYPPLPPFPRMSKKVLSPHPKFYYYCSPPWPPGARKICKFFAK